MNYKSIIRHYEKCFDKHGDTCKGVDWTRPEQVETRYRTMLELINFREKSVNLKCSPNQLINSPLKLRKNYRNHY